MRKFAKTALIAVLAGLLCGCEGNLPFTKKTPDLKVSGSFSAQINSGELEARADVTRNGEDWEFSFSEPGSLGGIVLTIGENGVDGHLGSLSFAVDENDAYVLYPEIIAQTLDGLGEISSENMSLNDGVLTAETEFDGKKVTLTADEKTGELISLKCPQYKLAVNFGKKEKTAEGSSSQ